MPVLMKGVRVQGIFVGSRAMFEAMNRAIAAASTAAASSIACSSSRTSRRRSSTWRAGAFRQGLRAGLILRLAPAGYWQRHVAVANDIRALNEFRSIIFIPNIERHASVGQPPDVRDVHGRTAAQLRSARRRRERRERAVRLARERDRIQEHARAERAFDAVRFLQDRPIGDDAPDQQSLRRQAGVEALLLAILQQEILAAVGADQHLEAFLRGILDRRQDQFLLDARIDDRGRDPTELLLGPGAEVLRFAQAGLVRHGAPHADAFGTGILGPGVQIGQAEHVAELVADDADVAHARAALLDDEVGPALVAVVDERLVRPVESAAIGLHAVAGIHEEDAVEFLEAILAVTGVELVERLGQQGGLAGAGVGGGVFAAFLGDRDVRKRLAFDAQFAERLLKVVIVHAAMDFVAGGAGAGVRAAAEQGIFPMLGGDLGVVLDVGIFDADDGEAIDVAFEGIEVACVPAIVGAEAAPFFAPLALAFAESERFGDERQLQFLVGIVLFDHQRDGIAGFAVAEDFVQAGRQIERFAFELEQDVAGLEAGLVGGAIGVHRLELNADAVLGFLHGHADDAALLGGDHHSARGNQRRGQVHRLLAALHGQFDPFPGGPGLHDAAEGVGAFDGLAIHLEDLIAFFQTGLVGRRVVLDLVDDQLRPFHAEQDAEVARRASLGRGAFANLGGDGGFDGLEFRQIGPRLRVHENGRNDQHGGTQKPNSKLPARQKHCQISREDPEKELRQRSLFTQAVMRKR